jgi:protein-S-isoprenylcysteine O-methyltransferase Ste14
MRGMIAFKSSAGATRRDTVGRRSFHFAANPTEGGLVTNGPYHYIRHPIYTAVRLWAVSALAGHWSWLTAFCSGVVITGALVRIFCEEKLVMARYPEYAQYAARTWRMVPFVF